MQSNFCKEHCLKFEATEENKLEYTTVFKQYTELIESYITKELAQAIEGFSMETFLVEVT